MNRAKARALFDDALYQVLDNLGFRLLAVLFVLVGLLSLVLGFREDGVYVLFYWKYSYEDFARPLNAWMGSDVRTRQVFLDNITALMIDWVADKFGFLFGIAAISFFVPQMLEKGAADTVFSKPVSRLELLLSRYLAGLIFVALLSALLVGGIYVGFLTASRHNDVGLLWGVLTLTYGFAVFHAISCTIGVFTRSAIAAILLTTVFMPVNCGFHKWWETGQVAAHIERQDAEQDEARNQKDPAPKPSDPGTGWLTRSVGTGVSIAHYVLPKTSDATLIARGLRRRIEERDLEFVDGSLGLTVDLAPQGFAREPRSSIAEGGLLWLALQPDGAADAQWKLLRRDVAEAGSRATATKRFKAELGANPSVSAVDQQRATLGGYVADRFDWTEAAGPHARLRRRWIAQIGYRWLLTLDYDAELEWARAAEHESSAQQFLEGLRIDDARVRMSQEGSYEALFGWTSQWRHNAWFSIATTLAFIAAVLAIGWRRLNKIDF